MAITAAYVVLLAITGCTISRHREAERLRIQSQQSSQTELSQQNQIATQLVTQAQTQTKIQETVDSGIQVPGQNITSTKGLAEILSGSPIYFEQGGQTLEVGYDKATNTIKAKSTTQAKTIPVKITRITETKVQANASQEKKESGTTKINATEKSNQAADQRSIATTTRSATWQLVLPIAAAALIALFFLIRWIRRNPGMLGKF